MPPVRYLYLPFILNIVSGLFSASEHCLSCAPFTNLTTLSFKYLLLTGILGFISIVSQGQSAITKSEYNQKGKLYFYWGWNRDAFSKSDMTFSGADYNFKLEEVIAKDRQTPFALDPYFNIERLTIPQYNFRIGYFIRRNWDISIGSDHMKYVMQNGQHVLINGHIENSGTIYDGDYDEEDITLTKDFLQFEHTDGLNYINIEARRSGILYAWPKISFSHTEGFGAGMLVPRTNTTLLSKERYDDNGFGIIKKRENFTYID